MNFVRSPYLLQKVILTLTEWPVRSSNVLQELNGGIYKCRLTVVSEWLGFSIQCRPCESETYMVHENVSCILHAARMHKLHKKVLHCAVICWCTFLDIIHYAFWVHIPSKLIFTCHKYREINVCCKCQMSQSMPYHAMLCHTLDPQFHIHYDCRVLQYEKHT